MNNLPAETEVVVIGSGAAGLAAALTAAEGGAKVTVFEKQRSLGGTSNFFEGIFAVESDKKYNSTFLSVVSDYFFRYICAGFIATQNWIPGRNISWIRHREFCCDR